MSYASKLIYLSLVIILNSKAFSSDSFAHNNFNNHGVIGLINMPKDFIKI